MDDVGWCVVEGVAHDVEFMVDRGDLTEVRKKQIFVNFQYIFVPAVTVTVKELNGVNPQENTTEESRVVLIAVHETDGILNHPLTELGIEFHVIELTIKYLFNRNAHGPVPVGLKVHKIEQSQKQYKPRLSSC
ncbi:hypothetical protein D3C87_1078200 [compost metagenome]